MTDNNKTSNVDKVLRAEERIKNNKWDIDAWNVLLRDAQEKPIEESRPFFEKLVKQFPLSSQYVKYYISAEKKAKNYENVDKLFKEYLPKIYHIELWRYYLAYVKEKDDKTTGFKERIAKAYDFASEHMGLDSKSFPIWSDYISFLKSAPAKNQYAESQKTNATRRVYNRAIVTPMIGIETIWRDYNTFENSINNIIARRFIEDRSRDYMNARRVAKEFEAVTKGLSRNTPSVPPQNTKEEFKQVDLWKKYINWEKGNPLNTDDQLTITKRTMFAYEQCLLCLGHHPDIWYEAASYLEEASKLLAEKGYQENATYYADKVSEMYHRGTSIIKESQLLVFAYADYEESRSKFDKVDVIYNNMIKHTKSDPSLVYIQYSRFLRRSKGILAARDLFKKARNDPRTSYHIYINSALLEHYCTKDAKVAHRIFELGFKKYMKIPEMVLSYVDYLDYLNEDNNTRVLFERCLGSGTMTADQARPIWDKFLQFESFVGDLASILKVERRRLQSSTGNQPNMNSSCISENIMTARVVDRYKFGNLYPCNESELKSMGYVYQITASSAREPHLSEPNPIPNHLYPTDPSTPTKTPNPTQNRTIGAVSNPSNTSGTVPVSCPKPDLSQMLPFKPRAYPRTGAHPVSGGEFPPPPSLSNLISVLPPPSCFQGPFPSIDPVMEHALDASVPEWFSDPPAPETISVDDGTALSIESAASQLVRKRRIDDSSYINQTNNTITAVTPTNEDDVVTNNSSAHADISSPNIPVIQTKNGPIIDIFKMRQQKRQKLTNVPNIIASALEAATVSIPVQSDSSDNAVPIAIE